MSGLPARTIVVRALLNDGEGRFYRFMPGDRLIPGPALELEAPLDDVALAAAWEAGNRMDPTHPWPANVRSLSAGDVLVLARTSDETPRAYTVEMIGFRELDLSSVVAAVAFGTEKAMTR